MPDPQITTGANGPRPGPSGLAMPVRAVGCGATPGPGVPAPARAVQRARIKFGALTLGCAAGLTAAFWHALAPGPDQAVLAGVLSGLFALNAAWVSAGAGTALLGWSRPATPRAPSAPEAGWRPAGRCAILWPICGEPAGDIARRVSELDDDLRRAGLREACAIFVLSDTAAPGAVAAERRALAPLRAAGAHYRNRSPATDRKPGNIADWVRHHGAGYATMLVLDADSRMRAARLRALLYRMETAPHLGLIQAGMRLAPGRSRFAAAQRLSARICGPGFTRGMAAWTGCEGNFWGHNALIRVRAFAGAAGLPRLPGRAPFGGAILSHDFIEAAWLRRAGWGVEMAPDTRASFEEAPETLAAFHRRDRRWCQGNLQHLRMIAARGLHPVSRLHLLGGVQSYLAAPVWLTLVVLLALGGFDIAGGALVPLAGSLTLLFVPKGVGLATWLARVPSRRRRRTVLRATLAELALTSLLAPLIMLRQSLAIGAVLAGRDCGWRPGRPMALRRGRPALPSGTLEATAGAALLACVAGLAASPATGLALIAPVALPLLGAPALVPWLDGRAPAGRRPPMPDPQTALAGARA